MKKKLTKIILGSVLTSSLLLGACSNQKPFTQKDLNSSSPNGVYYEIFVRAFADSNGDGIGDLNGVTKKLDYLKNLGIEGIWLMPINPSPSYHGYDVTDYKTINPQYGTLKDFQNLLKKAHKRHIKVLMDMVFNHTSVDNQWFISANDSKKSSYRHYYNWTSDADIIDAPGILGSQAYWGTSPEKYEGIFSKDMPDLNYDNPNVRKEIFNIGKYWLGMGVDGFRLDAAKYLYSANDVKTIEFWQEFRKEMNKVNPHAYFVGEVWDSSSVVGKYLNNALTSGFNFDLSTSIIQSVKTEQDTGISDTLERVREYYKKESKGKYIDSIFLTNHDMDRVMSQLDGSINHAKMAASILFTLPGNPFIYYGEELGMEGKKPDESIREPFLWNINPNTKGQSKWESSQYNTNRKKVSYEAEVQNPNSLFNFYKNWIYARRSSNTLIKGKIQSTDYTNQGLLVFKRTLGKDSMLVIHNLTGKKQTLTLDKNDQTYNHIYYSTQKQNTVSNQVKLQPYSSIVIEKK